MASNDLDGIDPRALDAMRQMLSNPSGQGLEGVDPRAVQAMRMKLGVEDPAVVAQAHAAAQENGAPESIALQMAAPGAALAGGLAKINEATGGPDEVPAGGTGPLGLLSTAVGMLPQTENQAKVQLATLGLGEGASNLGSAISDTPSVAKGLGKLNFIRSGQDALDTAKAIQDPALFSRAVSPADASNVWQQTLGQLGLKGGKEALLDVADQLGVTHSSQAGKITDWAADVADRVGNADQLKGEAIAAARRVATQNDTVQQLQNLAEQYSTLARQTGVNGAPGMKATSAEFAAKAEDFTNQLQQAKKDLIGLKQASDQALAQVPTAQDAITASEWMKSQANAPRELPLPQGAQARIQKKNPIDYNSIQNLDKYVSDEIGRMGGIPNPMELPGYGKIDSYEKLKQVYADSMLNTKMSKALAITASGKPSQSRALLSTLAAGMAGGVGGIPAALATEGGIMAAQSPLLGKLAIQGANVTPEVLRALGPLSNLIRNQVSRNGAEQSK